MMTSSAHVHINVSAKLKIGNRLKIRMKSLTHHKKSLSIRFHSVHQIRNIVARFQIYFFLYPMSSRVDMMIVSTITIIRFTGSDREIPVLKAGSKKLKLLQNHLS